MSVGPVSEDRSTSIDDEQDLNTNPNYETFAYAQPCIVRYDRSVDYGMKQNRVKVGDVMIKMTLHS